MTIDTIASASTARATDRGTVGADASTAQGATRAPAAPVETANAVKAPEAAPSEEQINDALSKLNKTPQAQANNLEFSVDQDTKRTVVKVVDQTTKEVVRQFPTKEALAIAKALDEQGSASTGLLIDQTA
ncbi:flagellar biosynthesis protein FlaG [Duganella sp. FT80W]|uniref:Flagellar biosynthesis protein FlaG n=1 Tax=Duganella guangzhouensis TaxID=2666084 RepID=A0A6I2KUI5_9BURK|nr:flagellar protein FlaG [Duganella guangzhouensis]MRW89538.1 flagellar biosynthesis protein FlaG [Duganella guangzhouensis]